MRDFVNKNRIFAIVIALSLLCTAMLIFVRADIEDDNKKVTMIMTYRDIEKYSCETGMSEQEALAAFADLGITAVVIENYWYFFSEEEIENVKAAGMEPMLKTVRDITVKEYDALCKKHGIKYPLYFSYRYLGGDADGYLKDNGITLALVENKDQTGHEKIRHFDSENSYVPMVRVFELIKPFASRYAVLGYEGAEEIENVLYRAVSDRNIRVLWITPFYDSRDGEMITDIEVYRGVFENLQKRMEPHGLVLGEEFSSLTRYKPNTLLVFGAFFGISALSVLLLGTLVPIKSKLRLILTLSLGVLSCLAFVMTEALTLKGMALIIASVMPCLAVYYLLKCAKRISEKQFEFFGTLLYSVGVFATTLFILLVGGSFVGAILSESRYMLEFEMFRGVKLSQAIPLVYAAVIIVKELVYKKGKSVRELASDLLKNASTSKKLIFMFGVLAILGAVALFIVRTGNTIIQAGTLEQRFRIFFEVTCVARPRTKEFLIAWPALLLCLFLFSQNRKILGSISLFMASIGCASVCNTFCHIRAYYLLSVIRTFYGAGIGLAIGLLVTIGLFLLLQVFSAWNGKQKNIKKSEKKC